MFHTYKAILHGDRLEWSDTPPDEVTQDRPVAVHVTILEQSQSTTERTLAGQQMAAILERLATGDAFNEIADPAAWQRAIRADRALPDRDD